MNKKYVPFLLTSLLLCGCVQGPNVSEENALEVAIDDSNTDENEVIASVVKKNDNGYKVVFATESGKYTYTVGTDGLIKKRDFAAGETMEIEEEQSQEEKTEEQKGETSKTENSNTDEMKTRAENAALVNVGLSRDQVTSITSELSADQTQYTVVIISGDSRTTCVVNAGSGEVISTLFE